MFKFIILMIIIIYSSQTSAPCSLDMTTIATLQSGLTSTDETIKNQAMIGLLTELSATMVEDLSECKSQSPSPLPADPTKEYTCCAGTLVPVDSLKPMLQLFGITKSEMTLCLDTEMGYTFQAYFDGIKEQFSNMIKSFTMIGCTEYNNTHMCNVGTSISSMTCAAYPLNPENLTQGYDTCCLMNYDDFDGNPQKKCFDAPKKNIDYLKQVVKNYKNWGYKGVVVDCFGNYIKFGFISLFVLVLVLF